jgi:RHS repeat-associated protein
MGTPALDLKFLYDGWKLIAELNANSSDALLRSYVSGLDLSGSTENAGGVGGLLAVKISGVSHFAAYDGNSNIVALVDGSTGLLSANYEYGAFGELIRASGPTAKMNPLRFSTKYQDDETGLVYFGYTYLNATTGRWLNADPLGEFGSLNLYEFCYNRPLYGIDPSGLDFLQDIANYSAGVADSLTMGLARVGRKGINWMFFDGFEDGGVDPTSGAYVAGEITEVVVEIGISAGGATLRHVARKTVRETVEKSGVREAFKRRNGLTGGVVHHANPIKGHIGGKTSRFPLPFSWAANGFWDMRWLPSTLLT